MTTDQEIIRFSRSDFTAVVAAMRSVERVGVGWINITPWLPDDVMLNVPVRSGLGAWFSGRGPQIPMATFIPGSQTGRRPTAAQVGVEHGTGPNALSRLGDEGLPLPDGWIRRQDHAKHGIVAELPEGVDLNEAVAWMLQAVTHLSAFFEVGDRWNAVVHRPG